MDPNPPSEAYPRHPRLPSYSSSCERNSADNRRRGGRGELQKKNLTHQHDDSVVESTRLQCRSGQLQQSLLLRHGRQRSLFEDVLVIDLLEAVREYNTESQRETQS